MGIREKMNENPAMTGGIVGVLIVLAIVWGYFQFRTPTPPRTAADATSAFFTEDDGKTYFPAPFSNLAKDFKGPNGKDAVRAYVFRYGKGEPFVAYMEKYTPAGKQTLGTFYNDPANAQKAPPPEVISETLIKKPGDKNWVSAKDRPRASPIRRIPIQNDLEAEAVLP